MTEAERENPHKLDLFGMTFDQMLSLMEGLGEKPYRARQLFEALFRQGVGSVDEITTFSSRLKDQLRPFVSIPRPRIENIAVSQDGTRKYQLKTWDGSIIEAVFICHASGEGRHAICLSSQAGCAMGCKFCATASLKLKRNLHSSEILSQIYIVLQDLQLQVHDQNARLIHNIVFMGMGEPLHNYDNVVQAIKLLTDPKGLGYAPKRITVSTSGLVPQITRLGQETEVHIAVSLNATTDAVRTQIMPVNRKWNIATLLDTCRDFPVAKRRRITFEYVLLAGLNDSDADAHRLIQWLADMPCRVNLIPYNPHPFSSYERPSKERIAAFQEILLQADMDAFVRTTRGEDIQAACGMLAAQPSSFHSPSASLSSEGNSHKPPYPVSRPKSAPVLSPDNLQ